MVLIKQTAENCLHTQKLLSKSHEDPIFITALPIILFNNEKKSVLLFSLELFTLTLLSLTSGSDEHNNSMHCRSTEVHVFS